MGLTASEFEKLPQNEREWRLFDEMQQTREMLDNAVLYTRRERITNYGGFIGAVIGIALSVWTAACGNK